MSVAVGDQRRRKEAQENLILEIIKTEDISDSPGNYPIDNNALIQLLRAAIERGWGISTFLERLHDNKKKKDSEIDRICSRHYADFLNSVTEMLKMRASATELHELVLEVHQKFDSTGGELVTVIQDLAMIQQEREVTKSLLESLVACKEVAILMKDVKKQIESDAHYQAMKTIGIIQQEMVSNVHIKPLIKTLQVWTPIAINKLLYSARMEFDNYMENLRAKTVLIGNTVLIRQAKFSMQESSQQIAKNTSNSSGNNIYRRSPIANLAQSESSLTLEYLLSTRKLSLATRYIAIHYGIFQLNAKFLSAFNLEDIVSIHFTSGLKDEGIDFIDYSMGNMAPLHKVAHLYKSLGDVLNLQEHYKHYRNEAFRKVLKSFEMNVNQLGLLKSISLFFEELVGFFMIESVIKCMVNADELATTQEEMSSLWIEAIQKFLDVSNAMGITLTSPDQLIQIKEELLLLIHVVSDPLFELDVMPLQEVILKLWDTFEALIIQSIAVKAHAAIEKSAYQPYYVPNQDVFNTQIRSFRLDTIEISDAFDNSSGDKMKPIQAPGAAAAASSSSSSAAAAHSERSKSMKVNEIEAGLDALEQEISIRDSMSNPTSGSLDAAGAMGGVLLGGFMSKTFAFSEFVPLIMKELHINIIRIFSYIILPTPVSDSVGSNVSATAKKNKNSYNSSTSASASASASASGSYSSSSRSVLNKPSRSVFLSNIVAGKQSICDFVCKSILSIYSSIADLLQQQLLLDGMETVLSKACQIFIDAATIASASEFILTMTENALEQLFTNESFEYILISQCKEAIIERYKKLTTIANKLMFKLLANKIDSLLESLVFINFEPDKLAINIGSNGSNYGVVNLNSANPGLVHDSIESIIEFLSHTFMWLTHLPQSIRESVHISACTKLSNGILSYLLSTRVKQINIFCLVALDADCKRLMSFSDSCGIVYLRQCFSELAEVVGAVLHPELPQLGDNHKLRLKLFPNINPAKLAAFLEKISPSPLAAVNMNLPRLDKNTTKSVAKKLRSL